VGRTLAYFFFFASALLLSGCRNDIIKRKVHFKGTARDKFTRYPIPDAVISLTQERGSSAGSTLRSDDQVGTTDGSGNFDFRTEGVVRNEDCYTRMFRFYGPGVNEYLYSGWFPLGDVDKKGENVIDVELYTLARLQFYFHNAVPFDQNDQVSGFYVERPWGQQSIEEGEDFVITSLTAHPEVWTTYYGYTTSVLHYTVTKNAVSQEYTDTVYTPDAFEGGFITDTIHY
jgi:hypothetical protein